MFVTHNKYLIICAYNIGMSGQNLVEKKKLVRDLVSRQLTNIAPHRRLLYKDLCRISKYISTSIASDDDCCIWNGYVTNTKNARGSYINFFFRNKKVALHRLLYENFIGSLDDNHYIKFTCEREDSDGTCCNVAHMIKYKYNTKYCGDCEESENLHKKNGIKQNNTENNLKDKIVLTFD